MSGSGEVYKRNDDKWAWRLKAANGQIVATDGGQGCDHQADARSTLEKVMAGEYNGPITEAD